LIFGEEKKEQGFFLVEVFVVEEVDDGDEKGWD